MEGAHPIKALGAKKCACACTLVRVHFGARARACVCGLSVRPSCLRRPVFSACMGIGAYITEIEKKSVDKITLFLYNK